jgi:hypothetical protein
MGRFADMGKEWEQKNRRPHALDGHQVKEVLWETDKMIIFKDPEGNLWRRVHTWGMTWPIVIGGRR